MTQLNTLLFKSKLNPKIKFINLLIERCWINCLKSTLKRLEFTNLRIQFMFETIKTSTLKVLVIGKKLKV